MKYDYDCVRDLLVYIYNTLDNRELILMKEIEMSPKFKKYSTEKIRQTIRKMMEDRLIEAVESTRLPNYIMISDLTYDGCILMKNLLS